jgi:hypothetical protein
MTQVADEYEQHIKDRLCAAGVCIFLIFSIALRSISPTVDLGAPIIAPISSCDIAMPIRFD